MEINKKIIKKNCLITEQNVNFPLTPEEMGMRKILVKNYDNL